MNNKYIYKEVVVKVNSFEDVIKLYQFLVDIKGFNENVDYRSPIVHKYIHTSYPNYIFIPLKYDDIMAYDICPLTADNEVTEDLIREYIYESDECDVTFLEMTDLNNLKNILLYGIRILKPDYNKPRELVYESKNQSKYRFKTEKEFINQYGLGWRQVVGWRQFGNEMDYLFGKEIEPICYKDYSDDDGKIDMDSRDRFDVDIWSITFKMIKEFTPATIINYNKPRELVYESISRYKYRIKTEQEFIDEYGEDWQYSVNWNNDGMMNYLFGKVIEPTSYKEFIDENGILNMKEYDKIQDDVWEINNRMIKEVSFKPDYNTPRQLVYESKIKKYGEF